MYETEDLKLHHHVALRFLPEGLEDDPAARERFRPERPFSELRRTADRKSQNKKPTSRGVGYVKDSAVCEWVQIVAYSSARASADCAAPSGFRRSANRLMSACSSEPIHTSAIRSTSIRPALLIARMICFREVLGLLLLADDGWSLGCVAQPRRDDSHGRVFNRIVWQRLKVVAANFARQEVRVNPRGFFELPSASSLGWLLVRSF